MRRRDLLVASAGLSATALAVSIGSVSRTLAATNRMPKGRKVQLDRDLTGYYVTPSTKGRYPAVVVIMEAFGLNSNIKSVCDRLAQAGYAALAPDFYHGAIYPYTDIDGAVAKLKTLKDDVVMAEFGKGTDFLGKRREVKPGGVGAIGFCMGGRYAFLANAVQASTVKAAVSFYGGGIAANPDPLGRANLLDRVERMMAPILLIYGAEDASIPAEEHQQIAAALSKAKKQYSLNVFSKAGHGFFSDRRDSYNPTASSEAWAMTLSFFNRHLKTRS
ncbi:dienelactone hydrolase family protein [Altericista sp. CCNU0014]|uniref:dienelactone hydrolase family protein n=1 Tax=Altericista sp. CCNU0014 TaxID=3082949 RepID=UPI00384ED855